MATIQEWLDGQTADGRELDTAIANIYRRRRGLQPLERALAPGGSPDFYPGCSSTAKKLPSRSQRAVNFAKSAVKHAAAGSPKAPQDVIDARLAICKACDKFDGNRCTVCGCGCSAKAAYLNKLSWADQTCPHPDGPKWGPVQPDGKVSE